MAIIKYHKYPEILEYDMIGDQHEFFADVTRDESVDFYANLCRDTKTLVHMAMQKGLTRFGVNPHIDGFKLKTRKGFDVVNNNPIVRSHFRILKKQGWDEFNDYVRALAQIYFYGMGVLYETLTINLYVSNSVLKSMGREEIADIGHIAESSVQKGENNGQIRFVQVS